ncbi:MAG: biopolymer transporter ExbD [Gammaproteobacteria bacterium]|nr:biopolymer transporter ExbD [Gammaproteobacteria bacterium]
MKFSRRRRPGRGASTVELTPLIDVVFLLLIFFMVSTTFKRESALAVELPDAQGAPRESAAAEITVRVGASGSVAVNDELLPDGEVGTVAAALDRASGARVVVAADAAARHDAVVRVLDAAGRSGLTEVRILTARKAVEDHDGGG